MLKKILGAPLPRPEVTGMERKAGEEPVGEVGQPLKSVKPETVNEEIGRSSELQSSSSSVVIGESWG